MRNNKQHTGEVILTGDRPTGPLHLGHYVGSLRNRVFLQQHNTQFIIVADLQALTDNADNPQKVRDNVTEVVKDYLAAGIDPAQSTIFVQSMIPEISELTILYLNLVNVGRLERNPTVKTEIKQKGFGKDIPAGFLMYPVSQAADITTFGATLVPVGEDQLPMIEQTRELVERFNRIYKTDCLILPNPMVADIARLPGLDGKAKMSKSLGNTISLKDSPDEIWGKVRQMFTDPGHLRVEDPGKVKGNVAFAYLDAFATDLDEVEEMKAHYRKGGLGDMKVKKRVNEILQEVMRPIRERREELDGNEDYIMQVLIEGTEKARATASKTMKSVKEAMLIDYWS